jgi:hypothetical protein
MLFGLSLMSDTISTIAAVISGITAIVTIIYVIVTFRILRANQQTVRAMQDQAQQEKAFRMREHFLTGIGTIAQYDVDSPGCEQAMRLLDYYSSLALSSNDPELFQILNTVMTAEIRKKLEEIQVQKQEIYVSAVAARTHIQTMLKDYHMQRKGLIVK